jgi:hypothetical protein
MNRWGISSRLNSRQVNFTGASLRKVHTVLFSGYFATDPSFTAEDNLNISLKEITVTGRDGRVSQLDQVYIRGSMVRFFIVPDMLQNAPMCV